MPSRREPTAEQDQLILGHALRALRKQADMTQEAVAEQLGVDPTFVGRLERGQRGAHWRTIRRVLAATNSSVSDFAAAIDAAERQTRA
jgi:transcriptional regulator with XRE-family HTH domain